MIHVTAAASISGMRRKGPVWPRMEHRLVLLSKSKAKAVCLALLPRGQVEDGWWVAPHPRHPDRAGFRVLLAGPHAGIWWRADRSGGGPDAVSLVCAVLGHRHAGAVKALAGLLGVPLRPPPPLRPPAGVSPVLRVLPAGSPPQGYFAIAMRR